MKPLSTAALTLSALITGVAIGYHTGVANQLYYDASAKIMLYSSLLSYNKADEYLEGQIFKQINVLNDSDLKTYTSELLLLLPPHGSEFYETYKNYSSKLPSNEHYIEANQQFHTLNKKYGDNTD